MDAHRVVNVLVRRRDGAGLLRGVPAIVLVVTATVIPFVGLVAKVLGAGDVFAVWSRPGVSGTAWFSVWMGAVSTVATLAIGLPAAWIVARHRFRGRDLIRVVLGAPFVLPTVVVGAAFLALVPGGRGLVAIVAAHTFFNISVVLRTTTPVFSAIHDDLVDAARTLGAGRIRTLREIVWPLTRSAVTAAAGLVFVLSATSYGIVRILGNATRSTIDVEIYRRAIEFGDPSGAAALALTQAVAMLVVVTWSASRRGVPFTTLASGSRRRVPRAGVLYVWILAVAVVLPIGALVTRSFRGADGWTVSGWRAVFGGDHSRLEGVDLLGALGNSIRFAAIAAIVAVPVAILVARPRRNSRLVTFIASTPVAVSSVIVGLGILITYDVEPFDFRSAWWLIPAVHASVALPYALRSIAPLVASLPTGLGEAAATLGASPWRAWWSVELPLLRPALATATATSLAVSLGEFGATSLLTRRDTRTLPLLVESLLGRSGGVGSTAGSAAATMLLVLTGFVIVVLDRGLRT